MTVWWKQAKFWLFAAVAVAFSILVLVLRSLFSKPPSGPKNPEDPGYGGLPPAPVVVQQAAEKAHEEALQVKAAAKATTDDKQKKLAEIAKIEDRKAKRKALSDFINNG